MVYQLLISTVSTNILLGGLSNNCEIVPISDSFNIIMELLGIKFNSLYMPLLDLTGMGTIRVIPTQVWFVGRCWEKWEWDEMLDWE